VSINDANRVRVKTPLNGALSIHLIIRYNKNKVKIFFVSVENLKKPEKMIEYDRKMAFDNYGRKTI
jgi:hypothetical protein